MARDTSRSPGLCRRDHLQSSTSSQEQRRLDTPRMTAERAIFLRCQIHAAVALTLIGACTAGCGSAASSVSDGPRETDAVAVQVATVGKASLDRIITVSGTLAAE